MIRIAAVQHKPEFLDLEKSTDKALELISECAGEKAEIVVFGESWFSGYPAWIDSYPDVAIWDHEPAKELYLKMAQSSMSVTGSGFKKLQDQARDFGMQLVFGFNEKVETGRGNGSLYNSLAFIGKDGSLQNHHRKLMPTYTEKLLYAHGDGHGLRTIDSGGFKLGGLICWEHWMPHARQSLHNEGETIHVAVWPTVHDVHQVASRSYAFEGRCFVISVGQILSRSDIPQDLGLSSFPNGSDSDLILRGGSCLIDPKGKFLVEPLFDKETIIYAEIDPADAVRESMTLDTSGHYSRPDVFKFEVNRKRN